MAETNNTNTNEETIGIELPTNFEQITKDELYVKILRDYSEKEHDVLMSMNSTSSNDFLYPITRVENVVDNGGKGLDKILEELNVGKKAIIDMVYPIGCFYETTDTSFNPNVEWNETWEQDNDGTVLISKTINDSVGSIIGNNDITLSQGNIPLHNHTYSKADIAEQHALTINELPSHNHNMVTGMNVVNYTNGTSDNPSSLYPNPKIAYMRFLSQDANTRTLTTEYSGSTQGHTHTIKNINAKTDGIGNSESFSVIQKSKVIIRWHRIA